MSPHVTPSTREVRRLQTRERILGAAIAEFRVSGMAAADVRTIVSAAGVAHGTFFFHFPSKEHVLLELEQREENRMAAEFARFLDTEHDLATTLRELVHLVTRMERQFGPLLFKDILGLHFSSSRPTDDGWTDHPILVLLVRKIEHTLNDGDLHPEVDAFYSAAFFLLGVYGVLTTVTDSTTRDAMLANLVIITQRGLECR